MSPTSTERGSRIGPVAVAVALALLAAGCAQLGGERETAAVAPGPDPRVQRAHDEALTALQAGDDAGAETRLLALVGENPDLAGPMVNLALLQARRGELEPAAALLEQAVTTCTQCAVAWNELGVVRRRQGRFDEAERAYRAAIAAEETYPGAHFNLAVLYELYLQRPELALAEYTRYRALDTGDAGKDVDKWMADLARRAGVVQRSAQLETVE